MFLERLDCVAGESTHAPEQVRPPRRRPEHVRRIRELGASLNRIKNILRGMVSVEEDMANLADGLAAPRSLMCCQRIDRDVDVRAGGVLGAQPGLELRALNLLHRTNPLRYTARLVGLQKHRDPVVLVEGSSKERHRRGTVDRHGYDPVLDNTMWPRNVDCARDAQSTPEKSASILVRSAVPTLSSVPVQPRGDG